MVSCMVGRGTRMPLALALVLGALIAGCGGGGKAATTTSAPSETGAESAIRTTITRAFTSNDPAGCVTRVTSAFIGELYGGSIEKCRRKTKKAKPARVVHIRGLAIAGNRAHARVFPLGGENDGQGFATTLVRTGSRWKIDSARYLYGTDPETDREVESSLQTLSGEAVTRHVGPVVAGCAEDRLRVAFKSAGVPLGSDETTREATAIILGCLRDHPSATGFVTGEFLKGLRRGAQRKLGPVVASCLVGELRGSVTAQEIVGAIDGGFPPSLKRKLSAAGKQCGATAAALKSLDTKQAS
jgi:hypothetical protein